MQSVAALGNNVRLLSREPETEAEGFKADGAFSLFLRGVSWGHDGHVWDVAGGERVGVGGSDLGRGWEFGGVEGKG